MGGSGAGIGGGKRSNGGTITITGGKVTASGGATSAGVGGGQFGSAGTIVISGGSITAEGGSNGADRGGAGIGNGASFSEQQSGSVTISGGVIAATGNGGAADIGNGSPNYAGTDTAFSTGQNGDAVIFAEEISDESGEDGWTGVFFRGSDDEVRGNVSPAEDFQIPAGGTLHFEDGSTLNLPSGTYLPGDIALTGDGTLNPEEKRPQAQVSIGGDPGKT